VWNGIETGVDRKCEGFVKAHLTEDGFHGVYAVDCEMSYTILGREIKVTGVAGATGPSPTKLWYVRRTRHYDTLFSRITWRDLNVVQTKTLHQVQNDLRSFVRIETILIGHGLENDLRALEIVETNVVDTSRKTSLPASS
jgi:RNA exonuclease 1